MKVKLDCVISVVVLGQIRPEADPGRGKNRSKNGPFFKDFFLETRRIQQQAECTSMI